MNAFFNYLLPGLGSLFRKRQLAPAILPLTPGYAQRGSRSRGSNTRCDEAD
jgi:hypothetical protein